MKKILLLVAVILGALSLPVYANSFSEVRFDVDSQTLIVEGNADLNPNSELQAVTIRVFKPGYYPENIEELSKAEKKSVIAFVKQTTLNNGGSFSFTYSPQVIEYGVHHISVVTPNGKVLSDNILFLDVTERNKLLSDLNGADEKTEMKSVLANYTYLYNDLQIVNEIRTDLPEIDVIDSVSGMIAGQAFSDIDSVSKEIEKAAIVTLINNTADSEGIINVFDKYKDVLEFSNNKVYSELYLNVADEISSQFVSQNYVNAGEFSKKFHDVVILYKINSVTNYTGVTAIFEAGKSYLKDCNYSEFNQLNSYRKVYAEKYIAERIGTVGDIDSLEQIFNEAVSKAKNVNESNNSGGSSGGGSSHSGGIVGGSGIVIGGGNTSQSTKSEFNDLGQAEWAVESINALYKKGIISGVGDGKFMPLGQVTREQFTKMIIEAYNLNTELSTTTFADVKTDAWYSSYIASAVINGIVNGISEKAFGIGENITRQDMAVIAYRAAQKHGISFAGISYDKFSDDNEIADYAKDAVYALKECGVMNGIGDNLFAPKAFATRAEAAKMIYGLISK